MARALAGEGQSPTLTPRCCGSARCYLDRVARVVKVLGFCLSVVTLMACGQGAFNPPKPAPRTDVETRVPRKLQPEIPRLLAPPPAYGDKIVMARSASMPTQN
jgi:hypothetical protein